MTGYLDRDKQIEKAVVCLENGGVVALPTDTLYGLSADALNPAAISKVFAIKDRPQGLALPVLIDSWEQLGMVAESVPEGARRLAERFWPGPLTLVVTKSLAAPENLTAGLPTVAVRMPDHPVPRMIARRLGRPITGTSANRSGADDPGSLEELALTVGELVDYMVTSGPEPTGAPSTIVDITQEQPKLLREGLVTFNKLLEVWG